MIIVDHYPTVGDYFLIMKIIYLIIYFKDNTTTVNKTTTQKKKQNIWGMISYDVSPSDLFDDIDTVPES